MARRPARRNPYRTNTGIHIEWFTVRRSSVYLLIAVLLTLAGASYYGYQQVFGPRNPRPVAQANTEADKARFLDISGSVEVRKSGTYEWVNANMAMALNRDDTIRTAGGEARVRLFDGTEYLIKPHSILVIERANEDPTTKAKQVEVTLTTGRLDVITPRMDNPQSRSEVQTPTTQTTFRENTVAELGFDSTSRTTSIAVQAGGATARAGDNEVVLNPLESVTVDENRVFAAKVKLPGNPVLVQPANLDVVSPSDSMEFRWRPVDGARKYVVKLDRNPYFPDPILESSVSSARILHAGLDPGTYYWEVTAIDADERRSAPTVAKFTVSSRPRNAAPPALQVYTPSVTMDGLVTVRGRTEPGAIVTADYGEGDDDVSVRADGSFTYNFLVRVAGSHRVIVKARKREGSVAQKTVYADTGSD